MQWIRQNYGVPAEIGMGVIIKGRKGVITKDKGNYIGVTFDDEPSDKVHAFHPTDNVEYTEMRGIRKIKNSRSKNRYEMFLNDDWYHDGFGQWLKDGWYKDRA